MAASTAHSSPPPAVVKSDFRPGVFDESPANLRILEEQIEKAIYGCRFLTLLAVSGSLVGSLLCFVKRSTISKRVSREANFASKSSFQGSELRIQLESFW
ncbi:uncharacterized protein LOC143863654 isoform X1 [Tasmannia lanceolata]|uniref:uncharacterized protein LOC143863654 isoform X1 n=1 Tax=Tasmannia lanceolata TaxID=3420 RepID=UPI004063B5D6